MLQRGPKGRGVSELQLHHVQQSSDVLFHDIDRIDTLFALAKFHSVLSRRSIATWSRKVAFFAPKRRRNEI